MFRTPLAALDQHQPHRCRESWAHLLTPLTLWICVAVTLRYGYYGNHQMALGPSSSRLFKASSVFVQQLEVRDYDKKGVFLYGFSKKPELSMTENWTMSNYVIIASYSRKGFSLWLNKGSTIQVRWEAQISCLGQLDVSLTKGERKLETLVPTATNAPETHGRHELVVGRKAEYGIKEDNKYRVSIVNSNPTSVIMVMNLNVSSKIYDLSNARSKCSTLEGSCQISLRFPNTHFLIVTTPNNGDLGEWYLELSFVARVVTYIAILVLTVIIILVILRYLGACDSERHEVAPPTVREATETDPLMPEKPFRLSYGTGDQDDDNVSSCSSEDLYDGKICVICYDEPRNCFFVPCGHCATCYSCAKRIMDGETKVCPICRRLIHKVRKLLIP